MRHFLVFLFLLHLTTQALRGEDKASAAAIVSHIQRADYEGDRSALKHLYEDLATFTEDKAIGSKVHYWRGFALWRSAINGFNDKVDPADLQKDLRQAADEFDKAAKSDPDFIDAKIGSLSCLGFLAYSLHQSDPGNAHVQELMVKTRQLWKEAQTIAPENPRLRWVVGPMLWNIPPERGGGQAKAIENYEKGLKTIRGRTRTRNDALEPSWGEPELLMSLAWSKLNQTAPDLKLAEQYANSALEIIPYWHYVRDILLPQIRTAMKNNTDSPR